MASMVSSRPETLFGILFQQQLSMLWFGDLSPPPFFLRDGSQAMDSTERFTATQTATMKGKHLMGVLGHRTHVKQQSR